MSVNLKDLLNEYCVEKGYSVPESNEGYYELFEYRAKVVWRGEPEEHRWYTNYDVVRKLSVNGVDYFFEDSEMSADGDSSREDCDWEAPNVEDLEQVFPKQVLTTVYVTEDKL